MSLFISYSSRDRPFVRFLRRLLHEAGVRIWVDEAEIKIGDSLIEKIQEGISDVEYLGAVLSKDSVESAWVKEELNAALSMQVSGRQLKVLPILIEDCTIPPFLAHRKYADFRDPEKLVDSLADLLDVLLGGQLSHLIMFGDAGGEPTHGDSGPRSARETTEPLIPEEGKVVCQDCRFHLFDRLPELGDTSGIVFTGTVSEKKEFLRTIWYNQYCGHPSALNVELDYGSGVKRTTRKHCMDMNPEGDCALFESREQGAPDTEE